MKPAACVAVAMLVFSVGTALLAQGFNLQVGTWEFTMSMEGGMSLDGIPPALRPQIEAELKKPRVARECVTAEDLKTLNLGKLEDDDDANCKVTSSKITPTMAELVRTCVGDEPRTDIAHFEAPNPQTLRANVSSKSASGSTAMTITGRWIDAQCKE